MPTYDYKCLTCGHQFEFVQSMNDARLTDCPQDQCDGKVKRLLGTGAGIIFKGTGFYETDYKRGDSYKKEAKADSAESTSSTAASSSESSGGKSPETSSKPAPAAPPAKTATSASTSSKTSD
jgi:putative FmdB family regulatory protein